MPALLSVHDITELLREMFAQLLEIDITEVPADADIHDSLCVESLQHLEMMTRVEERLHLTFDMDAWIAPRTVEDLARHIAALQDADRDD